MAALASAPASAQGATCTASPEDLANDDQELEMLRLLNEYRVANGRAPLAIHPDLTRAAAWFSRDMAAGNYLPPNHVDRNGRDIPTRFTWCGISYTSWAENIYAGSGSAQAAFDWWKNSPGHNTNMLLTGVTSVGIARAYNPASQFGWYWTLDLTNTARYRFPPGDFDASATTDVAVFRPSTGGWYVRNGTTASWGGSGDIPVPGDYDGNGTTDIAIFRPSTGGWYVRGGVSAGWGTSGDVPVPGDYDGNGTTDIAVFRPSTGGWYVRGGISAQFGASGDIPVPGDYDGNGTTDIAVFRPSTGGWYVRNGATTAWGTNGDIPVPGDYDGNGTTDIAVFRPSTGIWYVRNGTTAGWGTSGDRPLPTPAPINTLFFP
jgi:uncharacterized protein YkwD